MDICDFTFTVCLMSSFTSHVLIGEEMWPGPRRLLSHFSPAFPLLPQPSPWVPPYLCLCLMGSPCLGSIADVVQSHGGVFMDSSYPSSPVTGPLSRGQRRASEVSIASQVSGMADSYTATNIANSKCSQYQTVSLSLFLPLTQTLF